MLIEFEASLLDPEDFAESSLVAEVATVGTTLPLASGQTLTWDEESLKKFAPTLMGMPINVNLNAEGEPTSHSEKVIGAIVKSEYDPTAKAIRVLGSLWKHYYPATVERLHELFPEKKIQSSIEFLGSSFKQHDDGSVTPLEGRFSGLGLVGQGADKGQRVLLLASVAEDEARSKENNMPETVAISSSNPPVGSFEWIGSHTAEHLANLYLASADTTANVIGTFANSIVYTTNEGNSSKTFRLDFTRNGDDLQFGEPVQVETTFVPLEASREDAENSEKSGVINMADEKEFAELKASYSTLETELADTKKKYDELVAEKQAREAEEQKNTLADSRIAEIEKITPYKDETLKASHREVFKTADEKAYEQIKNLILASAEERGGIASDATLPVTAAAGEDPVGAEALTKLPQWREELLASFKRDAELGKK